MKMRFAAYGLVLALSTVTPIAAQAASPTDPVANQHANQTTDRLNRQQLRNGSTMMQQDAQQPNPSAGMPQTMDDLNTPQAAQSPDPEQMVHTPNNFRSFH